MREIISHCLRVPRNLRLLALHLVGNAVLMVSASLWLLVPEQHWWQLAFAVVAALALMFLFLWLHAGTLIFGVDPKPEELGAAFRVRMVQLGFLLLGFALLIGGMWRVEGWREAAGLIVGYVYSTAPSALRPIHGSKAYWQFAGYPLMLLEWYLLPGLILPFSAAKVLGGTLRSGLKTLLNWRYWLGLAVIVLAGVWLPQLILDWKPGTNLRQEMTGLGVRLLLAYVTVTVAWLMTAGLLGYFLRNGQEQ